MGRRRTSADAARGREALRTPPARSRRPGPRARRRCGGRGRASARACPPLRRRQARAFPSRRSRPCSRSATPSRLVELVRVEPVILDRARGAPRRRAGPAGRRCGRRAAISSTTSRSSRFGRQLDARAIVERAARAGARRARRRRARRSCGTPRTTGSGAAPAPIASRVRARISSRAALTAPPLPERLLRHRLQVARLRPCRERARQPRGAAPLRPAPREPLRPLVAPRRRRTSRASERIAIRSRAGLFVDDLRAQVQQHARDVDLDRADLVAGAAEARRIRQRLRVLDPAQLRREDRADRAGIDGAVRVAAGARVDRADVEARAAADAVQRLRGRPRRRARACGRCRAGRRGTPAARRPAVTPVQSDVYGFIRSPVDERGSSWRKTSRSAKRRHELLDAEHRHEHRRQRRAHPPVALGLDHARPCRSRRRRSSRR